MSSPKLFRVLTGYALQITCPFSNDPNIYVIYINCSILQLKLVDVQRCLTVLGKEKQWGSGRSQTLGNGFGLWQSRFSYYFLDTSTSFFYSRLAWRYLTKNFSRYIVVINIYVLCCFSWQTEVVNFIQLRYRSKD